MIDEKMIILKPRRLVVIMNLLTNGPMPNNCFLPHKETIEAKKIGINLGLIQIDPARNTIQLTSDGYNWILTNNPFL